MGETVTPVDLRDDQPEQSLPADQRPDFRGEILVLVDPPVVQKAADLVHRPVQECLLVPGEACRRQLKEPLPARAAGEQLRIPPGAARLECLPLGTRHGGQHLPEPGEQGAGHQWPAQGRDGQDHRSRRASRGQG